MGHLNMLLILTDVVSELFNVCKEVAHAVKYKQNFLMNHDNLLES